jgi:hypothetical protein
MALAVYMISVNSFAASLLMSALFGPRQDVSRRDAAFI